MIMVSEKIQLRKKASDSFSSDSEDEYELSNFKSFLCHPKRMLKLIIKTFGYVFLRLIFLMELRKRGLLLYVLQKEKGLVCCNRGFLRTKEKQVIS